MKILFILHENSRSGAPLVVFQFIEWLNKNHNDVNIHVFSLKGGPLTEDLIKLSKSYLELVNNHSKAKSIYHRIFTKIKKRIFTKQSAKKSPLELCFAKLEVESFDIVYSNSVQAIPVGCEIKKRIKNCKHITHIHELNLVIKFLLPNFQDYISQIDKIIAVSDAVSINLITNWNVPKNKILKVYEFSNIKTSKTTNIKNPEVFKVGGCGSIDWRKGTDLFLHTVLAIKNKYPEIKIEFEWLGNCANKLEKAVLTHDINKANLPVTLLDAIDDPSGFFGTLDLFLMTSREDPFPLVCIEAGMLGLPIICFENATGSEEIIKKGGGFVVPYLNTQAMAEKIIFYYRNRNILKEHGAISKAEFSSFTPELICPQLYSTLNDLLVAKNKIQ